MQVAHYDFTSTSTCTGSPIIVSHVRGGAKCETTNFEIQDGNASRTCVKSPWSDYAWQETSCSQGQSISFERWKRHYVVKELYMESGTCSGEVAQAYAVAADNMCHPLPSNNGNGGGMSWVMVNCNNGNPTWKTCIDSGCSSNCTTEQYGGQPCKLKAASASDKVRCVLATSVSETKTLKPTTSTTFNDEDTTSFANTVKSSSFALVFVVTYILLAH
jgi:hypothetical protein